MTAIHIVGVIGLVFFVVGVFFTNIARDPPSANIAMIFSAVGLMLLVLTGFSMLLAWQI